MNIALLLGAFLRRDAAVARSYRLAFVLELSAIVSVSLLFYFLSNVVSTKTLLAHGVPGGRYFPFVLIGVASLDIFDAALLGPSSQLRGDQVNGTLEPLLATPAPAWLIVAAGPAYQIARGMVIAILTLGFGVVALGLDIKGGIGGVLLGLAILVPTIVMSLGGGLLLAAVTVLIRRAGGVSHLVTTAVGLGCGVYYPVSVLPVPLRQIGQLLPPTWFLELERAALLGGDVVVWKIAGLVGAAILAMVLGVVGLNAALRQARRRGTLTHY